MAYDEINQFDDLGIEDEFSYDEIIPYIEDGDFGNHESIRGVSPKDAFILQEAPKFAIDKADYSVRVRYEYGVSDPVMVLKKLKDLGLIRPGKKIECMANATVPLLKEIAKKNGLKVSGKKSDLIDRIVANVPENVIEDEEIPVFWKYTDDGIEELKSHRYLDYFQKDYQMNELMALGINVNTLNEAQYNDPDIDFEQLVQDRIVQKETESLKIIAKIKPGVTEFSTKSSDALHEYGEILEVKADHLWRCDRLEEALNVYLKSFFILNNILNAPHYEDYGKSWARSRDWCRIHEYAIRKLEEKIEKYGFSKENACKKALTTFEEAEGLIKGKLTAKKFWEMMKFELENEEDKIIDALVKQTYK